MADTTIDKARSLLTPPVRRSSPWVTFAAAALATMIGSPMRVGAERWNWHPVPHQGAVYLLDGSVLTGTAGTLSGRRALAPGADTKTPLADWWNEREADMPAFAQTTVARLASDLEVLRQQGFRLAVIDTPPAITMAIQSVIGLVPAQVVHHGGVVGQGREARPAGVRVGGGAGELRQHQRA